MGLLGHLNLALERDRLKRAIRALEKVERRSEKENAALGKWRKEVARLEKKIADELTEIAKVERAKENLRHAKQGLKAHRKTK